MLGLAGGTAGVAVHAYLLAGLLQQADPASDEVKRLALGITLGVAGLAAALAVRASQPVSMAFLFSLGVLGFFPNLTTWAPAGALLIIAGTLVLLDLRLPAAEPTARAAARPAARSAPQPATPAATFTGPDGTPLHWSVVARYFKAEQPARPQQAPAAPAPVAPNTAVLSSAVTGSQAIWSPRSRLLVIATVVTIAALVVPFSLWPQESTAVASELPNKAAANVAFAPGAAAPDAATPSTTSAAVSSTTSTTQAATLARVGPVDPSDPNAFVLFSDVRFGLTLSVPKDWAEVPASSLADYRPQVYHVVAFAEVKGTTLKGAYLDGLTVEMLAGSQSEDPPQELVQQSLQAFVDGGPGSYGYFKVLEPIHDATVGGVPALVTTVRITWNKRVMVKSVYTFIANHCLYRVDLQTDDVDWNDYQDLFDQVLASFAFTAGSDAR
jgi:hypothetical protein